MRVGENNFAVCTYTAKYASTQDHSVSSRLTKQHDFWVENC